MTRAQSGTRLRAEGGAQAQHAGRGRVDDARSSRGGGGGGARWPGEKRVAAAGLGNGLRVRGLLGF